jgi:hypothetical protein
VSVRHKPCAIAQARERIGNSPCWGKAMFTHLRFSRLALELISCIERKLLNISHEMIIHNLNHGTKCRCGHLRIHISLRLLRILNKNQKKISLFSSPSLTDTQNEMKILVAAVVGIQHMLILEEVLMEESHHIGKLFGVACLLHQRGPCFDQYL